MPDPNAPSDLPSDAPAAPADPDTSPDPSAPDAADAGDAPVEREAIIYLPGLLHDDEMQGAAQIGLHVAEALDQTAESGAATFAVTDVRTERIAGADVRSVSVLRADDGEERTVVDVFDLDYRPTLLGGFAERPPIRQAVVVAGRSVLFFLRFLAATGRPGQRASHRTQLFLGMAMLALVLAYTGIVVVAAFGTAAATTAPAPPPAAVAPAAVAPPSVSPTATSAREARSAQPERAPGLLARLREWLAPWIGWFQAAVVAGAFAGLLTRRSVKEILEQAGVELSATGAYLDHAAQREVVVGAVARLLNRLEEREAEGVRYTAVHLVGYSFGSVVAMDALFHPAHVGPRFRRVASLVTIGLPFDFVRTYWPDYFRGRTALPEVPARWINVVAPADVFGSRFDDPERDGVAGVEMRDGAPRVPDAEVTFGPSLPEGGWTRPFRVALFLLAGRSFRAHRAYWETGAVTAWEPVVQRVFAGRPMLG